MNYVILGTALAVIITTGAGFVALVLWTEHQLNKEGVDHV